MVGAACLVSSSSFRQKPKQGQAPSMFASGTYEAARVLRDGLAFRWPRQQFEFAKDECCARQLDVRCASPDGTFRVDRQNDEGTCAAETLDDGSSTWRYGTEAPEILECSVSAKIEKDICGDDTDLYAKAEARRSLTSISSVINIC